MIDWLAVPTFAPSQRISSVSRCLALLENIQKHHPGDLVHDDLLVSDQKLLRRHHFLRPHVLVSGALRNDGQIVSGVLVLGRVADFREREHRSMNVSHVAVVRGRQTLVTAPRALQILNFDPVRFEVVFAAHIVVILRHCLPRGFQLLCEGANVRSLLNPRRGVQNVTV